MFSLKWWRTMVKEGGEHESTRSGYKLIRNLFFFVLFMLLWDRYWIKSVRGENYQKKLHQWVNRVRQSNRGIPSLQIHNQMKRRWNTMIYLCTVRILLLTDDDEAEALDSPPHDVLMISFFVARNLLNLICLFVPNSRSTSTNICINVDQRFIVSTI